jgi:hypothetical protein
MTFYINRQAGRYHETIDEFENCAEAYKMKDEYQTSEHGRTYYYVSKVPRKNWVKEND